MELTPTFFIDHALTFHLALSIASIASCYMLLRFFKLAAGFSRFIMDSQSQSANEVAPQGVFLLRRHALDARLPGTAA